MDIDDKTKIEGYFKDLDVDYSKIEGSIQMAESMADFIDVHVKKGIALELVPHGLTSVHHDLKMVSNNLTLVTFRASIGQYDVKNLYDTENQLVVNIPHHEIYSYYISELIKNITFFKYIMVGNKSYEHVKNFSEPDFYKRLNVFKDDDYSFDYGVTSIEDSCIVWRFKQYSLFVSIKINKYGTNFCFSGRHGIDINTYVAGEYFKTFHDLVCHINKYLYDNVIEPIINVPAYEFTLRHREVMKMIAI